MEKVSAKRIVLTPMSAEELQGFAAEQTDAHLKAAYSEMLSGLTGAPQEERLWYTLWQITLSGARIGTFAFLGAPQNNCVELGYGIEEAFRGHGYATEAVAAMVKWASRKGVYLITAQADNPASCRVLEKAGFIGAEQQDGPVTYRYPVPAPPWGSIGACLGIAAGVLSAVLSPLSLPMGLCFGILLGLAIGITAEQYEKKKRSALVENSAAEE